MKIPSSEHVENMLCTQIVFCFCFDIQNNLGTQHVLHMLRGFEKDFPNEFGSKMLSEVI